MNTLNNGFKQVDVTTTDSMNDMINAFNNNAQISDSMKSQMIYIKQKYSGTLWLPNGKATLDSPITINHNLGYAPSFLGYVFDSSNPHRLYPVPHIDYDYTGKDYVSINTVIDMWTDDQNLYINIYRSNAYLNSGEESWWYRAWIFA